MGKSLKRVVVNADLSESLRALRPDGPAEGERKDVADAVARGLYRLVEELERSEADRLYVDTDGQPDRGVTTTKEPGVGDNRSNQFELVLGGSEGSDLEQGTICPYLDVLTVTVEYKRRELL